MSDTNHRVTVHTSGSSRLPQLQFGFTGGAAGWLESASEPS
ncbi:hypothetical protein M2317_002566 [Microbacterium sp. ZKA21]|jgi:hypothetical protein